MLSFINITYLFTLLSSILTLIAAFFVAFFYLYHFRILPKPIRIYFHLSCFPYIFVTPISTGVLAILTLFDLNLPYYLSSEILSFVATFAVQMIRSSFFFFIIERIFATIYWRNYKLTYKITAVLFFVSYGTTLVYIVLLLTTKYTKDGFLFVQAVRYYIFAIHLITLFICAVLYYFNKKMYKTTAYRITLKSRYQILENVKILAYMFPTILIYTVISPWGSLASIVVSFYFSSTMLPSSILYIFYNLPLLFVCLRHIYVKPSKDTTSNTAAVKNVFGETLPTFFPTENYFQGLKQQWK